MGAFDANREDVITIRNSRWEPHESCRARTIVRAGDEEWVLNQQMLIQQKKGNRKQRRAGGFRKQDEAELDIKSQLGATNRLWVQRMLVDWTFTKGGQPIEISSESMKLLEQSYVDYIYEEIMKHQPHEEEEEKGDDGDDGYSEEADDSPFFGDASTSTDGGMNRHAQEELQGSHRNFLMKS